MFYLFILVMFNIMCVYVCCVHIEITATCCGWSACMSALYIYTYHIIYLRFLIRCTPYYSCWICVCMYIFGIYLNYSSMLWMICMSVSPIRIHISYVIYVQYLCLIFSIYNILFIVRISYYSSKIILICMFVSPICVCIHKPYHICSMQVWFSIR